MSQEPSFHKLHTFLEVCNLHANVFLMGTLFIIPGERYTYALAFPSVSIEIKK